MDETKKDEVMQLENASDTSVSSDTYSHSCTSSN